jgi:PBP1b-binding outer membrane lipoprotein LpoB
MRKIILSSVITATVFIAGCSKKETVGTTEQAEVGSVTPTAPLTSPTQLIGSVVGFDHTIRAGGGKSNFSRVSI